MLWWAWAPFASRRRVLMPAAALGALIALTYYGSYVGGVVRHVWPSALGPDTIEPGLGRRMEVVLGNWDEDLGGVYATLAITGVLAGFGRLATAEGRLVRAWAAVALAVVIPVFLLPESFFYFRRVYFATPAIVLIGATLARASWRAAAVLLAVVLCCNAHAMSSFVRPFYLTHSGSLRHAPPAAPGAVRAAEAAPPW
jgi:hypothetical protein